MFSQDQPDIVTSVDCSNTILGTFFYRGRGRLREWRGKGLHASYTSTLVNISDQSDKNMCPICSNCTHSHKIHRLVMAFFKLILTNFREYRIFFELTHPVFI